eukprot:jgi/Ulvmu1/2660/UM014_0116.1
MAGGQSSQKNKAHKPGRRAGQSARARNRHGKNDVKAGSNQASQLARKGKESRMQQVADARKKSRQEALQRMRHEHAPVVIQLLSASANVDEQRIWDVLRNSCDIGSDAKSLKDFEEEQTAAGMTAELQSHARKPATLQVPGRHSMRITLLPPLSPEQRQDVQVLADVAKAADVVLLCMAHPETPTSKRSKPAGAVDAEGSLALQVLRSMGLPQVFVAVQGVGPSMKQRSHAKKLATSALEADLSGDLKVSPLDTVADCVTLLRLLVSSKLEAPLWRQGRPALLLEGATFSTASPDAATGTLLLDAYVREAALTANQALSLPGAGDFGIDKIWGAPEQVPLKGRANGMAVEQSGELPLLAAADAERELVTRENPNAAEQMDTEQTWPTEDEMAGAAPRRRRLPPGTSDYQACWILDDEPDAESVDEEDGQAGAAAPAGGAVGGADAVEEAGGMEDGSDGGSDVEMDGDADEGLDLEELRKMRAERQRRAADEDLQFPDEMDTPHHVPARERFAKFRGLKSFRTSQWDPKEDLPPEYAKVFAFENFPRARKLAIAARKVAIEGMEPDAVPRGTYVRISLPHVPVAAAARVCDRVSGYLLGSAPALVAIGLSRHECKLSVLNMAVKRLGGYDAPVANKEEVTVITGLRSFEARPVLSTNDYNADKFKQEKFMHEGRTYTLSVFAPISFPPLPVLIVKKVEGQVPQLIATGSVEDCNPDRIVLKRVVLTGYPVKVHKKKAVVRYMFFNPDDVKWFAPLEVWTKYGRRGRIKESLGTHGAMKCVFDSPVPQHDSVCLALYKRVYPKWPQDLTFNL